MKGINTAGATALLLFAIAVLFAQGSPDLVISALNTNNVTTDSQTLAVGGTLAATIRNTSPVAVGIPFKIVAFEDRNANGIFNSATDLLLGSTVFSTSLAGNTSANISIALGGTVTFRGNLIYLQADSDNTITETDETNNVRNTGQTSQYQPPPGQFSPTLKWSWTSSTKQPTALNVMSTPAVIDLNGDSVPDVVFGSTANSSGANATQGYLRALSGRDGSELFTVEQVTPVDLTINTTASVAVGDIDLDGRPEIIAQAWSGHLLALEHDGSFKWKSSHTVHFGFGAAAIADMNGDGTPEIVFGNQVFNNSGVRLWAGTGGSSGVGLAPLSVVSDVDLDGSPDVVAGNTVYSSAGAIKYRVMALPDGLNAVGNFDLDPQAEIILVANAKLWLLEHDLTIKWGPIDIPGGGPGGPPTVADFDNDGLPEIAVAGNHNYAVFETNGQLKWQAPTQDISSGVTGSSVFDFEGDGSAEVIYRDELKLRIYRGTDGVVLFETPMSSCTLFEYPLVADVDNDGRADLLAVANNNCGKGPQRGVFVYGDSAGNWVRTRKIWNQHSYHITNINEDGSIPRIELPNWLQPGLNNFRLNTFVQSELATAAPDVVPSYIRKNDSAFPVSVQLTARVGNGGATTPGVIGPNLITNADFTAGNTEFTSQYSLQNSIGAPQTYAIGTNPQNHHGAGLSFGDHTTGSGPMLLANGATSPGVAVWQQSVPVTPGSLYHFNAWGTQWSPRTQLSHLRVEINGTPAVTDFALSSVPGEWRQFAGTWQATSSVATIRIIELTQAFDGNDFALDDLVFREQSTLVPVSFYRGDPASGGTRIATTSTSKALAPGQYEDVSITWNNPPVGLHPVVVVADDDGTGKGVVNEGDETNNKTGTNLLFGIGPFTMVDGLIARFKDSSVDLTWPAVTGATRYNIYRRAGTQSLQLLKPNHTTTSYSDTGLTNFTTYSYTVRWINAAGQESGDGTEISATPAKLNVGDTPPTILSTPVTRATVGKSYSYQMRVGDPDSGEVLAYSLVSPPSGMTITNSGLITWTPATGNAGYNSVQIRVTDLKGRFAGQTYQLFAEVQVINNPPAITSTSISAAMTGELYAYTVKASDPDTGDLLTFSLDTAPNGMSINSATGLIQWTPTVSQLGSQSVTARVRDLGGLFATQTFTITVTRGNKPPVFSSLPVTTARVSTPYTYQPQTTDPDGDPMTFSLALAPSGMSVSAATGLLQWTPSAAQEGSHTVSLIVSDNGGLSAAQNFVIIVQPPNRPPVITSTPGVSVSAQTPYTYQVIATDPDVGDALSYVFDTVPSGMTISPTGLVEWTPPAALADTNQNVSVRVTDIAGLFAAQSFILHVTPADTTRPFVDILSPVTGSEQINDFAINGTVTDDNIQDWRLEYRSIGTTTWTTLGTGTTPVTNAPLGTMPTTLLANDVYRIRLTGRDAAGQNSKEIEVMLNSGQLKLGDFTLSFEDLRVPGFTFPISILRKYDTKRPAAGDFGPGWSLGFSEVDVRTNANLDVFITLPDGRRVRFNHSPVPIGFGVSTNRYLAQAGVFDTLENLDCPQLFGSAGNYLCDGFLSYNPQNYRLTTKEGFKYTINVQAGVQRMEDRAGNFIQIASTGITSNFGRNVTFQRDAAGRITRIVEPGGGALGYEYDASGRLTRFTDQNNSATTFFYESTQFPTYLTKLVDPLGRPVTRTVFNSEGRLVAQCDPNGDIVTLAGCARFDSQPTTRVFTAVDPRGFKAELFLDAQGNVLTERRYLDSTTFLDTVRTYDANNNLLTERDPAGNTKTFGYDARGNRLTERDAGNHTTTYTYNPCDKVATERDPAGSTTTYTYDAQCNLRFVRDALNNATEYRYSAQGQRTQLIDPQGSTWTWSYNSSGLLTSLTDPFGKVSTFTFNSMGDLLARVDRNNRRIDFTYDNAHRMITEHWDNGHTATYVYNSAGQLTDAVDPDSALKMTYDTLSRLQSVDNIGTPGAPRVVMSYTYDANGNVTRVQDSLGGSTHYTYDALNRLSRVMQSGAGVQEKRVDMLYDNASLLTEMRRFANLAGTQPVANTRYTYDCEGCSGRLTNILHRKASGDSLIHDLTFTPDAVGNITQMIDAEGVHTYGYDNIPRLTSATHSNPALQPNEFYTYDAAGNRLTSHLSPFYQYSYQTTGKGNHLLQDNQFNYSYDDEGNLIRKTDRGSGAYTDYIYDYRGRMTSAIQKTAANIETARADYAYDSLNRRNRAMEGGQFRYFVYDGHNPILKVTGPALIVSRRLYTRSLDGLLGDEFNHQTRWFLTDTVGTVRDLIDNTAETITHYSYDSFGRLLAQSNPAIINDVLFSSREFNSNGSGYFRARLYEPAVGRFIQQDPLPPFQYDYALNRPLTLTDKTGTVAKTEWLAIRVFTAAENVIVGIGRSAGIGAPTCFVFSQVGMLLYRVAVADLLGGDAFGGLPAKSYSDLCFRLVN